MNCNWHGGSDGKTQKKSFFSPQIITRTQWFVHQSWTHFVSTGCITLTAKPSLGSWTLWMFGRQIPFTFAASSDCVFWDEIAMWDKNNSNRAWKRTQIKRQKKKKCLPLCGWLSTFCTTRCKQLSILKILCGTDWSLLREPLSLCCGCHGGCRPDKEGDSEPRTQQKLRGSN